VIVELLVVSLDLANLLVEQDLVRQLVVNDLLVDLRDALGQSEAVVGGQPRVSRYRLHGPARFGRFAD